MRRTAFTLPAALRREYTGHVTALKGYGPKGKSRWVREALAMLIREDPGLEHVGLGVDLIVKDVIDPVYLDENTEQLVEKAYRILRTHYPRWEGVQGDLIRAAILYRLSHEKRV